MVHTVSIYSHIVPFIDTIPFYYYSPMWFLLLLLDTCLQRSLSKQTFVLVQNRNEIIRIICKHQRTEQILCLCDLQDWELSQVSAQPFVRYGAEESCSPNFDLCMMLAQMTEHMERLCRAVYGGLGVFGSSSSSYIVWLTVTKTVEDHH